MKSLFAVAAAAGVALALTMGSAGPVEAKHKCGHKRICKPLTTTKVRCQKTSLSATATGTGAFGLGTRRAQAKARAAWEDAAAARYGTIYADWSNALGAHFDCKRNLSKATCTAIAKPCRP